MSAGLTGVSRRTGADKAGRSSGTNAVNAGSSGAKVGLTSSAGKRRPTNAGIRVRIGLVDAGSVVQTGRIEQITVINGRFTS